MRAWAALLATAALAGCTMPCGGIGAACLPPQEASTVRLTQPSQEIPIAEQQVLFWDDATRRDRFAHMEDYFAGLEVSPAPQPHRFLPGDGLPREVSDAIAAYMRESGAVGIMVVKDNNVRYASRSDDFDRQTRWTSFSVAKSFTSTLLGAAIADGAIDSLDDPVTKYVPALAGSVYDPVTVRQVATMTSGVKWNENYTDPNSDVARMLATPPQPGEDQSVTYMRTLEREAPPGTKFVYKTGETNLLGIIVENATGRKLADYAYDKIVVPAGFADPMFWMVDLSGRNIGGCCLSLTLADYARFGQFALEGGEGVVPDGWFAEAGTASVKLDGDRFGYGYQWWTYEGRSFGAQGIFGQSVTIVPEAELVVAIVGNWPTATSGDLARKRGELVARIAASVIDE